MYETLRNIRFVRIYFIMVKAIITFSRKITTDIYMFETIVEKLNTFILICTGRIYLKGFENAGNATM